MPDSEKGDLTTDAERLSYDWVMKKYGHEFLFITDYQSQRSVRSIICATRTACRRAMTSSGAASRLTTGAQREHRYDVLKSQAQEKGLDKDVEFYLEFFKYGCPPHGGFGIGIDRLTMLMLGLHIKRSNVHLQSPNRLTP